MWSWLERLLYGSAAFPPVQEVAPTMRTSQVFDSHVLSEAAARNKNPQAVSLAWDEGRAYGFNSVPQSWQGMTPRERKETLLSIFLANPWASNCIDTIALYITSGGYTIEPRVEKPDERQRDEIEALLMRINEGWDFNQYVYDGLTDEMIFGEYFSEYTMSQGKPYQLFSLDCLTMDTEHDKYGRVVKYKQQLTSTTRAYDLKPDTIIRWWNPHKRAKVDPFSPLEGIQDAILLDKKMVNWMTTFFQKGGKFNYYFKGFGDQDEADRFLAFAKANFFGEKNAQTPPVLWGDAEIAPLGNMGPVDMSFDKGLDRMQTIVLAAFHVPPSIACIAESGNRLSDMSDGQRKILQYIACDPRRNRFFEKFNYRLIYPYFGTDYRVSSRYADFRDDETLAKVADTRIRNGSLLIDEVRQEMGKEPYADGGGDVPVIVTTKEVTPVPRLKDLEDEQRQTAQVTLDTAKANADLAQTKAKQAKEPPPPMPVVPPGGNTLATGGQLPGKPGNVAPKAGTKPGKGNEDETFLDIVTRSVLAQEIRDRFHITESHPDFEFVLEAYGNYQNKAVTARKKAIDLIRWAVVEGKKEEAEQHNTGMMLAFLLDPETAGQLAIPNGEPASELHITLAYLGDTEESPEDGLLRPHTAPKRIQNAIASIANDCSPLDGTVGGVGRFSPPSDTDPTPVIALVDVPGLVEIRTRFANWIRQCGYFIADDHGYTPHITLAYIDKDTPMPVETVPPLLLNLDTVWLCIGDERIPFKLGGGDLTPPAKESHEEHNRQAPPSQNEATDALHARADAGTAETDHRPPAHGRGTTTVPQVSSQDVETVVGKVGRSLQHNTRQHHASPASNQRVEESHEEQTTHPQGHAPDAEQPGTDPDQGHRSLHPLQAPLSGDSGVHDSGSGDRRGNGDTPHEESTDDSQSVANRHKAELAAWIATLFLSIKHRGAASLPTLATALTAYLLSDQDKESLAQKLAEVNLAARLFAYTRDMEAVGLAGRHAALTPMDLLSWGYNQVDSIAKTLQEQLAHFLAASGAEDTPDVAAEVGPWIDRYSAWKAPQIANNTWGSGANNGSNAAIEDMLDAATDPNEPGLISTDNIRIRVVPGESSSDYCADYAGHDYSVSDYLALGMVFPAHPGCIHTIEAYLDDENALGGDDA
jgi:2'-5' RNA ligase